MSADHTLHIKALAAALDHDDETLCALLAGMTKFELATLGVAMKKLGDRVRHEWRTR